MLSPSLNSVPLVRLLAAFLLMALLALSGPLLGRAARDSAKLPEMPAGMEMPEAVATRGATEGRPQVQLKQPGADQSFRWQDWPARAPRSYADASGLRFPAGEKLLGIDFGRHAGREGHYTGPDGGAIYQWRSKGRSSLHYLWKRKDGTSFLRWPDGSWRIEAAGHQVHGFGGRFGGHVEWTFPDGAKIWREASRIPRGQWEYFYVGRDRGGHLAFQMFASPGPEYLQREVGSFQFHFHPDWTLFVERFAEVDGDERILDFGRDILGFYHRGPLPVRLYQNLAEFRKASGDPRSGPGGFGGMFGVSACCGSDRDAVPASGMFREAQAHAESFHVLWHEAVHTLQQQRCTYVRAESEASRQKPAAHPGDWFVEGIADFAVAQLEPRSRAWMYREFYKQSPPAFRQLNYQNRRAYIFGRVMLEYMLGQHGADSIREYYDATCRGTQSAAALRAAIGMTPEALYKASVKHYRERERRARIEAQYPEWEIDGLYELEYTNSGASRMDLAELQSLTRQEFFSVNSVPDIFNAYRLELGELGSSNFKGYLRTADGWRVYLFPGEPLYGLDRGGVKVFIRDAEVSLEYDGHRLINWANGQRRHVFPDGRYYHVFPNGPGEFYDRNERRLQEP